MPEFALNLVGQRYGVIGRIDDQICMNILIYAILMVGAVHVYQYAYRCEYTIFFKKKKNPK